MINPLGSHLWKLLGFDSEEYPHELLVDASWARKHITSLTIQNELKIQDGDLRVVEMNGEFAFFQFRIEQDFLNFLDHVMNKLGIAETGFTNHRS